MLWISPLICFSSPASPSNSSMHKWNGFSAADLQPCLLPSYQHGTFPGGGVMGTDLDMPPPAGVLGVVWPEHVWLIPIWSQKLLLSLCLFCQVVFALYCTYLLLWRLLSAGGTASSHLYGSFNSIWTSPPCTKLPDLRVLPLTLSGRLIPLHQ